MGGFAVAIAWSRTDVGAQIRTMLDLIPHRGTHGTATAIFKHAALGEARTDPCDGPVTVTTVGRFSIVGDLRLWDRVGLRGRAGDNAATAGMSDRKLILAAYGRTGIGFLDDLDGDYSFVIWDEERRRVLAVRDRFAARPLYCEPTANGIRFASEAKQLAVTSEQRPEPCNRMVDAYLSNTYTDAHLTFFEGIRKVPPSEYLLASETITIEREYWRPSFRPEAGLVTDDVPIEFRGRLTESVRRRSQAANGVVAHLSGGLDSSAITAAAAALHGDGALPEPFHTASAVFPGSSLDESPLITATAALQPFEHHEFIPLTETIEQFATAMWESDGPVTNRIRDLWAGTARIAQTIGADTVLMGSGGDEVVAQDQLLVDLLRHGRLRRWYAGAADEARWYGLPLVFTAGYSAARTLPAPIKQHLWSLADRRRRDQTEDFSLAVHASPIRRAAGGRSAIPAPSLTQGLGVDAARHPRRTLFNEAQEAEYAYLGLHPSYPYLDRSVVEYVASLPPATRPFDGSAKTLIRLGFGDSLPRSVLDQKSKTLAGGYLSAVFDRLAHEFVGRYPSVPTAAAPYVDPTRYRRLISSIGQGPLDWPQRLSIWNAWTVMLWLEGLVRYQELRSSPDGVIATAQNDGQLDD